MQISSVSTRASVDQRIAQIEHLGQQLLVKLKLVSLARWQALIMLLLVVWLSHSLVRLLWLIVPAPAIPPAAVAVMPVGAPAGLPAAAANININELKNLTPFGDNKVVEAPAATETVAPSVEDDAADTQLNLTLRGVVASNVEAGGRAVINVSDRDDVYAVGDTLPIGTNVKLVKVLEDRVILDNNGHYETLWLFKEDPNAPRIASTYVPSAAVAPAQTGDWSRVRVASDVPYREQAPIYNGADSGSPMRAPDPAAAQSLADVVAMSIYREAGQVMGYKIRPGRNSEQFFALGLQVDDVVTAVNGVPLSSPGKIMEIYKSMGNATSANLEIKRGGGTVNLDIVLK
jgi:general secretion pathway protein C